MAKIKVAELFYSIQGEGRYMGVPSVFLRTFGCNFTCGGFNMPKGMVSNERDLAAANIGLYKNYGNLPLVATGCDSYASWDPRFKHLSPSLETDEIAYEISKILPFKHWEEEHLVITGGEPLLGWQRAYPDLLNNPAMRHLQHITFETNGTQRITVAFSKYLKEWLSQSTQYGQREITFSVSPKLSVSGENQEDAIRPVIVEEYQKIGPTYLKYVIATEEDAEEALRATKSYQQHGFFGSTYFMPVGGTESVYNLNNKAVALLAMKHGVRYSDRLQVPLFKNEWGT